MNYEQMQNLPHPFPVGPLACSITVCLIGHGSQYLDPQYLRPPARGQHMMPYSSIGQNGGRRTKRG